MKRFVLILVLLFGLTFPANAMELTVPEVPDGADALMPAEKSSFTDGLLHVFTTAFAALQPEIAGCIKTCGVLFACAVALSLLSTFQGMSAKTVTMASVTVCACILLTPAQTLIRSGVETVTDISQFGKLLLPVMATALASQGGSTSSAALYAGTAVFDSILSMVFSNLLIPMVYVYLAVGILCAATGMDALKKGKDLVLWFIHWSMKTLMYIFTGYLTVTGVIGGATDQMALKATKVTLSSAVPVVGGILSDASETILVSAGMVKNSVGVWGLISIAAIVISPFLKIGVQYLFLKASAALCGLFGGKAYTELIGDFASAMGLLLAMTGAVCLLFVVSTICFMKGMG